MAKNTPRIPVARSSDGVQPPAARRLLSGPVQRYLFAVTAFGLACLLRFGFGNVFGSRFTFITFFPAVMLVALFCGFGPGLLATGLSAFVVAIWILPPVGQFSIADTTDAIGLAMFVCIGIFMSVVAELYHQANAKVAAYEQEQAGQERRQQAAAIPDMFRFSAATLTSKRNRMAFDSVLALVLAILVSVGWLAYRNMNAAAEADQLETHTYLVINELCNLLSSIKDAESGQSGFIITGDQQYLMPYQTSLREIEAHLAALRRLTADNPTQQQRLAAITPKVAAKLAELKEVIALRQTRGYQAASEAVTAHLDKSIMDELRALVGRAQREEEQLLLSRTAAKEENASKTIRSVVLGGVLGGLVMLLLFVSLKIELDRRRRTEAELRAYQNHLTDLVDERTRELRREQEALRASEARLNFALQTIHTGAWELNLLDHTAHRTLQHDQVFGYETRLPEWTFEMFLEHVLPEDRQNVNQCFQEATAAQSNWDFECRIRRADGEVRWIKAAGIHEINPEGKPVRMAGIVQDVTERRRSEEALRLHSTALQTAANGIAITNRDGTIVWVNDAFTRLTGYSFAEAVGQNPRVLKSGQHPPEFYRVMWATLLRGEPWRGRMVNCRKDGSLYTEEMTITPVCASGSEITHFVAIKQDITERLRAERALRESEERMAGIVNSAMDAIISVDGDQRIVSFNAAAEKMFGFKTDEAVGQPLGMLMPSDHRTLHNQHVHSFAASGVTARQMGALGEVTGLRANGQQFPIEAAISQIEIGGRKVFTAILRDITARRQAEAEIRELNSALEERVRRRTAELEGVNKELEAFCYSVAHDLRAPLRSIDGFSLAVLQDYGKGLDAEGRGYLDYVRTGCQQMGHLIDDLLKLSRVTRTPVQYASVNLTALAQGIASDLQRHEPGRVARFRIADGLVTAGDPHLLEAALRNLIENAWKFTAQRAESAIEVGVMEKQGETGFQSDQVFFVRDNGVGFDMAYADKLFAPFQRLHSKDEFPGTGIGLATVQRIFQRHGGRIWAEAAVDSGATFYFTLNQKAQST